MNGRVEEAVLITGVYRSGKSSVAAEVLGFVGVEGGSNRRGDR